MRARYPRTGVRECHYVGMIYADRNKYCTTCVLREYCNTYFALVAGAGRRCTTVCTYACVAFAISSECRSVCVALVAGAGRRCTCVYRACVPYLLTYLHTLRARLTNYARVLPSGSASGVKSGYAANLP